MIRRTPKAVVAQPGDGQVGRQADDQRQRQGDQVQADQGHRGDQEPDADGVAVDRDGAEAVDHQVDEVHLRPAVEPGGPAGRDRREGCLEAKAAAA